MWAAHELYWAAFTGPTWASYVEPLVKLAMGMTLDPCAYCLSMEKGSSESASQQSSLKRSALTQKLYGRI